MTMSASSRTVKNRSWRRRFRSPALAGALDPDALSGWAEAAALSRAGSAAEGVVVSAGEGQDARAIAGSSARGAVAGRRRSAGGEGTGLAQKSVRSRDLSPSRRCCGICSVTPGCDGAGPAAGQRCQPGVGWLPPRRLAVGGPRFLLALLQPGELRRRSGFGGLSGIGETGERGVKRTAGAVPGRVVPVGRRDAPVGDHVPARVGPPAIRARAGLGGQALVRTRLAAERGPDPLGVVDVGRHDADARAGAGHGGRAGPGGPDREIRVLRHLGVEPPPPFLPVQHVPLAGADVGREDGQAGQAGAVLGFLQDVARVVCPGRHLVVPDRGGVAQRAQVS